MSRENKGVPGAVVTNEEMWKTGPEEDKVLGSLLFILETLGRHQSIKASPVHVYILEMVAMGTMVVKVRTWR